MRCGCSRPDGDRYLAVFHLMHHLRECDEESAYHYSRAAATLAAFLAEKTAFFGEDSPPSQLDMCWTAAILLRHVLQLVCNAHAPTKLIPVPTEGSVAQLSEERIATAIYPSASYMNHACDPSIINSFWERTLIVRNVKPLRAGEEVFHCYGPHHARAPPDVRRRELQEQYHFTCPCRHCTRPELRRRLEELSSLRCLECGGVTLPSAAGGQPRLCVSCGYSAHYGAREARLQQIQAEALDVCDAAASAGSADRSRTALRRLDALLSEAQGLASATHEALHALHDQRARLCTQLGEPDRALDSLRRNVSSVEARYGTDSVELGNLLLTVTDLLMAAWRVADTGTARSNASRELRKTAERGLAIFSIHYGSWSGAYQDLRRKLLTVSLAAGPPSPSQ
ncbi:SET and MYND domain-containing protein 4-like [Pollicipes pollicipes]|uniref:SET and MYND domain-containing protein 4-like n=1 Tax=Pollicipes pollicipes TaxID=41117 RepID=UPI00188527DC|nr:SET and MYND domain-containing protein 4-like [Pollicipes pollicipes]